MRGGGQDRGARNKTKTSNTETETAHGRKLEVKHSRVGVLVGSLEARRGKTVQEGQQKKLNVSLPHRLLAQV